MPPVAVAWVWAAVKLRPVGQFVTWLGGLGTLDFDTDYRPHEFRFEVRWNHHKGTKDTTKTEAKSTD